MNQDDFSRVMGIGALAGGVPVFQRTPSRPAPRGEGIFARARSLWPGLRALAARIPAVHRARPAA